MTEERMSVWVKVNTVVTYKMEYMVEVPADHPEYALDTVAFDEGKEFHQEYLGEQISEYTQAYSENDAIAECRRKNEYCASWTDQQIKDAFFTSLEDQESANV